MSSEEEHILKLEREDYKAEGKKPHELMLSEGELDLELEKELDLTYY